jgi:HrpA-like RNA helicase
MGALTDGCDLTWLGKVYADLPCDIRISRLCLFGFLFGGMEETIIMSAILSLDRSIFKTFSGLPYRFSQNEHLIFRKKLELDEGRNSDPIM